ncbi:hypothetical protein SAMN05444158_7534 [Bradyrhizobium canariense]|uniref:Uncharacterized protein n=1 Tax=Bradyrhizobium canariense TaxID=255045 RepID=A0A1H2BTE2_9BRAD|nr:hypothetical protein SAMN05444158_0007 [Bradyrhizobium canariense]SDT61620.1 hypothetical protein SAMN05444158_7534 [Bradyrhizobium canariense]
MRGTMPPKRPKNEKRPDGHPATGRIRTSMCKGVTSLKYLRRKQPLSHAIDFRQYSVFGQAQGF